MKSSYDKNPGLRIDNITLIKGWAEINGSLKGIIEISTVDKFVIAAETYTGVRDEEITSELKNINPDIFIDSSEYLKSESEIKELTYPDITDDRIFGRMTSLDIEDFISVEKKSELKNKISKIDKGLIIIYGPGASLIYSDFDLLLYFDMARWEIQKRMKAGRVHGLGVDDSMLEFSYQYKRGYFVDWRVCDKLKQLLYKDIDYVIDTNRENSPGMLSGNDFHLALENASGRPFRVVPYFDPGPWGGQWMKEVCDLDRDKDNFAWCFDCVPEENSLIFFVGDEEFETPSINLVFTRSKELLGKKVEKKFGKEFPIRFDFLDTMGGGNLSLQVHPTNEYIKEVFGMDYTQDESYYLLDAEDDATVYLGLKDSCDPEEMISELRKANKENLNFKAEKHINVWPAKKHDHFLIPAGTVH